MPLLAFAHSGWVVLAFGLQIPSCRFTIQKVLYYTKKASILGDVQSNFISPQVFPDIPQYTAVSVVWDLACRLMPNQSVKALRAR